MRATRRSLRPWRLYRHLKLLNLALAYLEMRMAPVSFLRALHYDCGDYIDDQWLPFTRLIVEMPPRHGKSELCSHWFPAWYLSRNPHHRAILCSYEARFARTWGLKARDAFLRHGRDDLRESRDSHAANDWSIEQQVIREAEDVAAAVWEKTEGGMLTAGVGGPITGRGADLLIVDDPVKNAQEAESEEKQRTLETWWDSTAYSRLEPGAVVLVIQTRWHENDLAGQVLKAQEQGEDSDNEAEDEFWYRISFPAIAEENDQLGRQPGEPLCEERYPLSRLLRIRARISSYFWASLYQQRPSPVGGAIFNRADWRYFRELPVPLGDPKLVSLVIVDTATDDKESGDPVGIMVMHRHNFEFYITSWVSVQMRFGDMQRAAEDGVASTRPNDYSKGAGVLVEDVPWARPLIHQLEDAGYAVIKQRPEGSKRSRALAVQSYHEGHNVYLPEPGSRYYGAWVGRLVEQCASFPTPGVHDEGVDNLTAGLIRMGLNMNLRDDEMHGIPVRTKALPKPLDISIFDATGSRYDRSQRGKPRPTTSNRTAF